MTNSKKCSKCKKVKDLCNFSKNKLKKDNFDIWCNSCKKKYYQDNKEKIKENKKKYYKINKEKIKEYRKKYYQKNKKKINIITKEYYKQNKDKLLEQKHNYYKKNKNKRYIYMQKYYQNNKEIINYKNNEYQIKRRIIDGRFKLKHCISSLINQKLKNHLSSKNHQSTFSFLPYTIDELKQHLEKLFTKGMTWNNHTTHGWHIDHIKPDSLFNYKLVEDKEFQECWALENLQPMWADENIKKGNKYNPCLS